MVHKSAKLRQVILYFDADPDLTFHFYADPGPTFHSDAEPDPIPHQSDQYLQPMV